MKIEKHLITEINESEYNPRIALDRRSKKYAAIKRSLEDYGYVEPIVVNDYNMNCVGGHQRLMVLRDLGQTEIECVMVHIESIEKEKALCVALNKIGGEWDDEKLEELLSNSEVQAFELGFENLDEIIGNELDYDETDFADEDYEQDDDETDAEDEPQSTIDDVDDEDNGTVIKIGNYKFEVTVSEYKQLIASIRDMGIFAKQDIINELKRRLCND